MHTPNDPLAFAKVNMAESLKAQFTRPSPAAWLVQFLLSAAIAFQVLEAVVKAVL